MPRSAPQPPRVSHADLPTVPAPPLPEPRRASASPPPLDTPAAAVVPPEPLVPPQPPTVVPTAPAAAPHTSPATAPGGPEPTRAFPTVTHGARRAHRGGPTAQIVALLVSIAILSSILTAGLMVALDAWGLLDLVWRCAYPNGFCIGTQHLPVGSDGVCK